MQGILITRVCSSCFLDCCENACKASREHIGILRQVSCTQLRARLEKLYGNQ